MLTCKEATRLCSESLDRTLGIRERLTLRVHLMMCSGCTNYNEHMQWLRRISAQYAGGAFAESPTDAASQRSDDKP